MYKTSPAGALFATRRNPFGDTAPDSDDKFDCTYALSEISSATLLLRDFRINFQGIYSGNLRDAGRLDVRWEEIKEKYK